MQNYFDSVAQNWDDNQLHHLRTEAIANEIRTLVEKKEGLTALEFGAGTGLLSMALKDLFSEITLMDNSLHMICTTIEKLAETEIQHLVPFYFQLEKKDYDIKTFDVIFSQMAMHHVVEVENVISKFYKMLAKGGKLLIADLYSEDGTFHDRAFEGHFGFDPDEFAQLLAKHGFTQVKHYKCFEIPKEMADKTIKRFPIFLMYAEKS